MVELKPAPPPPSPAVQDSHSYSTASLKRGSSGGSAHISATVPYMAVPYWGPYYKGILRFRVYIRGPLFSIFVKP